MSFADPNKLKDYANSKTPLEVANHELIAKHYSLPSINLAKEVYDKIKVGEFSWEYDFKNLHPAPFGQEIYFQTIKSFFNISLVESDSSARLMIAPTLPTLLNQYSFDNGSYHPVSEANLQKGFQIIANWSPSDGMPTREGFVNVPLLEAVTPGSELSFSFKGTAVGIAVVAGPDAGIVGYSIDGKPFQKMDLYTNASGHLHLPGYHLFAEDLKIKKHVLRIRVLEDKNPKSKGTACRIVYFLVNE